jgi:hypothetical protein
MSTWPFEDLVRNITVLLIRGEYARLEALCQGVRLGAADLARAVSDYGRTLSLPPEGRDPPLGVVEVIGSGPRRWAVDVPLWSLQEGPSDLTLQLHLTEQSSGAFSVEIDDLHVL